MSVSKNGRGRRGTGKPSGKDRTVHEAARGKKKVTLSDLTSEKPSEGDLAEYLRMLQYDADDRGCAIMGAAFVEHCLEMAIRGRIVDPGKTIANSWFVGPTAPFSTFSAKIQLGRALAIYADQMHGQLSAIKDIRNTFAHRALPLEFDHPAIVETLGNVAPFANVAKKQNLKLLYSTGCIAIGESLVMDAFEHGGKQMTVSFP